MNTKTYTIDDNNASITYKKAIYDKHQYIIITNFKGSISELDELIKEFVSDSTISKYSFISTQQLQDANIIKLLNKNKFKSDMRVLSNTKSILNQKTNDGKLLSVRFSKENSSLYKDAFMKLLLEYDTQLAKDYNNSIKYHLRNTNLIHSRTQQIRVSYFIKTVLDKLAWNAILLFEETDKDHPIGFIKGLTENNISSIEVFINKKYIKEAIRIFISNSEVSNFIITIPTKDTNMDIYNTLFNFKSESLILI